MTFAELPSTPPNYIFPLTPGQYFGNQNLYQFSNILYPPLYYFGDNGEPVLDAQLSIGLPPKFSANNTVVTIALKHWRWSNGQPITARDVTFWLNLLTATTSLNAPVVGSSSAPGPGWGSAVPGGFPYNLVSYAATSEYTVVLHLNGSYNPTWFTYNELSQITPLPQRAWDKLSVTGPIGNYDTSAEARVPIPNTSPPQYEPRDPGTATAGALGVAQFLNSQAQSLSTYASNPLWKVVDGAFKLAQFTTSGFVKMVPNPEYSGTPKPKISAFEELPFTTDSAEYDALESGSLTVGYIPSQDLSVRSGLEHKEGYRVAPWYDSGFTMARYNFTNPSVGPLLNQLYFRQAMQYLINQPEYIKAFDAGFGAVTNGPVPTYPPGNPWESPLEAHGSVYPYNPAKAVQLLREHGWAVRPGGVSYCQSPGAGTNQCGAGISKGARAVLTELYASGISSLLNELEAVQSAFSKEAGIQLSLNGAPFGTVISITHGHCTYATPCSDWEIGADGGGWTYGPDFFPTGGELLSPGAGPNLGDYRSPTLTAYIDATHTAKTVGAEKAALFRYENYVAQQLPYQFLPTLPAYYTAYKSAVKGLLPFNVFDIVNPQLLSMG